MTPTFDAPPFRVVTEATPEAMRVIADGELDIATVPALEAAMAGARLSGAGALILDLSGVMFIDSSGVKALIDCAQQAQQPDAPTLSIVSSPQVDRVIEITGLRDRLPLA